MKETPKELIDNFTRTYTDLIQDICCYSQQNLPLTIWVLERDFKTVASKVLAVSKNKPDPFNSTVKQYTEDNAVAYVAGGVVMALARTMNGKSTDKEIDSSTEPVDIEDSLSYDDVKKDPNTFNGLIVLTSCIDATNNSQAEMPTTTIDNLSLYRINKKIAKSGTEDITLTLDSGVPHEAVGANSFINILGDRFGLRQKW
tara:strand:- start:417 stop:1016 length:600 start_codon:yes stop_codon:yes gene_type:complete